MSIPADNIKRAAAALQQYAALYKEQGELLAAHTPAALRQRGDGDILAYLDNLCQKGFRDECFKYTDIMQALAADYGLNLKRTPATDNPEKRYHCNVPSLGARTRYVANDVPAPDAAAAPLPAGVRFGAASEDDALAALAHTYIYNGALPIFDPRDPSDALCQLLSQDALVADVADGVTCSVPLQIVNVADARLPLMMNRRIAVNVGAGAALDLIVCDHSVSHCDTLSTQSMHICLGSGATLRLTFIEENASTATRFNNVKVSQGDGSRFVCNVLSLHTGLSRNTINVFQNGTQGAYAEVNGVAITDETEHFDNYVKVHHLGGIDNESRMLMKYVLGGSSTAAFTGEVYVGKDAQRIHSEQSNANLLTSDAARILSRPVLEIYADDVQCNHGSTIGKLDENALFYMRQRGIPEAEARLLLQHAFVNEVLARIEPEPLRERLSYLVEMRFRRRLKQCGSCTLCKPNNP